MYKQQLISVVFGLALLGGCTKSSDRDSDSLGGQGPVAGSGGSASTEDGSVSGGAASGGTGGSPSAGEAHWVGTWAASPYPVAPADLPPVPLGNAVLRQVVRASLGGDRVRLQLSNQSGDGPVVIRSVHLALCNARPRVDSTIDTATDTAVSFSGAATVSIGAGQEVWSDPVDFRIPPLGTISITTAFESVPNALTGHAGSRTTSYVLASSSDVSAADMASAQRTDHWYYISGIDVMADASARSVVAIGDSITDGRGTDTNGNNRWTDVLAARLQANPATSSVAVLNQGIGATSLIGSSGTAGEARFARDVLGQSGVKYAIVYHGVNDIGGGASFEALKGAYDRVIAAAHGAGLLIYGGTIPPFAGHSYYTEDHESVRQQVNAFIKSGAFDAVIDFDAALTDGGTPPKLQTAYATWAQTDGLHPGPAGYQKMGETPDLELFTR